jgi:hypothetical protein
MLSANVRYLFHFSAIILAGIIGDIFVSPYLLPDRRTFQKYFNFLGASWRCGFSYDAEVVVSARWSPSELWGDMRQWLNATYARKWIGRGGPVAWPPRSPDITPMLPIPVETPERARLRSPFQDYGRSRGSTSRKGDNGWYQYVKECSRECHAAHCYLSWNGRRPLRKPAVVTTRCQGRIKGFLGPRHFSPLGPVGDSKSIVGTKAYSWLSMLMEVEGMHG